MQIIPALYIKDNKIGIYPPDNYLFVETIADNPYDYVDNICAAGADTLLLVDTDNLTGEGSNAPLIGSLCNITLATLYVRGGINNIDYLHSLQYGGVDKFVLDRCVFADEAFLQNLGQIAGFKEAKVIVALDVIDRRVASFKDQKPSSETAEEAIEECLNLGFTHFLITDLNPDRDEPDFDFFEDISNKYPQCFFIAGGDIYKPEHVQRFKQLGLEAVLIGGAVYQSKELLQNILSLG